MAPGLGINRFLGLGFCLGLPSLALAPWPAPRAKLRAVLPGKAKARRTAKAAVETIKQGKDKANGKGKTPLPRQRPPPKGKARPKGKL